MAKELDISCARPVGSEVEGVLTEPNTIKHESKKEEKTMIMIGREAPDFTAPGYQNGKFLNFKLSDYRGKWVLLCFYPGDFTFV